VPRKISKKTKPVRPRASKSAELEFSGNSSTHHELAFGFALWRVYETPAMRGAHTHPDIELNWIASSKLEYVIAGKRAVISAGELGIFWGGVPHQVTGTNGSDCGGVWATLPLSWFLSRGFSNDLAARLMSGELVTAQLEQFRVEQWEKDFQSGASTQKLVLLELEVVLERIALLSRAKPKKLVTRRLPEEVSLVETITSFLAANFREPLAVQDIADAVDLHPKYLMTVFKAACGITVKTYLLHLRLAHAQRLLSTTPLSILDVAMDSGFGSLGRFYDSFALHVGERPLAYRRRRYAGG
jgi:AraC family transcriptional regulator, melibiose operon regulatory protein